MKKRSTTFITYSRDDEEHIAWVKTLAVELKNLDVPIILDEFDLQPGDDINLFMEKSIESSDFVLVIITPDYVLKADNRRAGVGAETSLITPEFYRRYETNKRFIPIVRRRASQVSTVPKYLESLFRLDMQNDDDFQDNIDQLIEVLMGSETGTTLSSTRKSIDVFDRQEIGGPEFYRYCELRIMWHPQYPAILNTIRNITKRGQFPKAMSIMGDVCENPIYDRIDDPRILSIIESYLNDVETKVRIMPMDILLLKARDVNAQSLLLQYYSGSSTTGWDTWLFPHGYHLVNFEVAERMVKNARDLEVDLGLKRNSASVELTDNQAYSVSYKPDFGYRDSLVLYVFTFCYCKLSHLPNHLRNMNFSVTKGNYEKRFRWTHLEDLRNDLSIHTKNGDIHRSIHVMYNHSLNGIPYSFLSNPKIRRSAETTSV